MDVLGSANQLELSISRTQMDEERNVRALASGLRVITASDDPSGLAVAENIHAKVSGLQQGIQNVQTAGNLLNTADAALASVQGILTRIHSLIVEASSDINSVGQLDGIQSEIDTLLREVNKIASSANFNGVSLLDGSTPGASVSTPQVTQITSPPMPDGTSPTGSDVANYDLSGVIGPLVASQFGGSGLPEVPTVGSLPAYITIRVTGYSANAVDPDSGTPVGAGDYVQIIAYSNSPQMGAAPLYIDTAAVPVNSGQITMIQTTAPSGVGAVLLDWSLANLTAADVGASMTFETGSPNVDPTSAKTLSFNATGTEGGDIQIALPSVSTASLNISDLSVMPTNVVDFSNQISGSASNAIPTADAEARVQMAIDAISEVRARVGAQAVSLQEDANDASLEVVNQVASESAIRDVNVGQAATDFIKDQVLARIDVSVLSQMQVNAQLVIQLVGGASPGTQGRI